MRWTYLAPASEGAVSAPSRTASPESSAPALGEDDGKRAVWWSAACWVLPAVVAALLGAWTVSHDHSLWYDEVYTAEVAPLAPGDLVSAIVRGEGPIPYLRDAPPSYNGPYYLVVHAWLSLTGLEADEFGLRLLSLLGAVGAVGVFAAAVRTLAGPWVALVAGLVLGANPFLVQYAAEARGYSLALLAVTLAALGLARWLAAEGQRRRRGALLLYGVGAAAAGLLHWFALLVVAGFAVAALVLRRRPALPVAGTTAAAAVPALALVATAVANGVGTSGAEWLQGVGSLDVPRLVLRSWSGRNLALAVLTIGFGVAGLLAGPLPARVVGAAWSAVPIGVVALLELVRPVFVDRYLLPAAAGLAILVALGVIWVGRQRAALTLAAAGAVLAASVWATGLDVGRGPKEDIRGAVEYVADRHQVGEPVVAPARWDALGLDHFSRRDHREVVPDVVLAPPSVPEARSLWVVRRSSGGVKGDSAKVAAMEAELMARGMRVAEERRFEGRYTDTVVQRWVSGP